MAGFGSLQTGVDGPAGIEVPPPTDNTLQRLIDLTEQIEQKYVEGRTNQRVPLRLAANQALLAGNMAGQPVNSLLLTVTSGVIYVYLYDVTANNGKTATPDPDLAVSAGVVPSSVQVMLPEREDYYISVQEGAGSAAIGNLRILKV